MHTERISQIESGRNGKTHVKRFSLLPEMAPLDRDGSRVQLNFLFWRFHMGYIGQEDFENKVVDSLMPVLKKIFKDNKEL
jgi:hypothetical protein